MIIPIRCFTCGKPVGHLYEEFKEKVDVAKENTKKVLDSLELERICCRGVLLSHIDSIDEIMKYD